MTEHLQRIQALAEKWRPEEVMRWAFATYQQDVAISSGFGIEGMVLIDMASRVYRDFRVFTLDTEFLFPETYDLIDRVEKRYGVRDGERVLSALTPGGAGPSTFMPSSLVIPTNAAIFAR